MQELEVLAGLLEPDAGRRVRPQRLDALLEVLLRADAGTARLPDGDPWHHATRLHRRLAYVPGEVTPWPNLSGGEIIDLLGRLCGGTRVRCVELGAPRPTRPEAACRP